LCSRSPPIRHSPVEYRNGITTNDVSSPQRCRSGLVRQTADGSARAATSRLSSRKAADVMWTVHCAVAQAIEPDQYSAATPCADVDVQPRCAPSVAGDCSEPARRAAGRAHSRLLARCQQTGLRHASTGARWRLYLRIDSTWCVPPPEVPATVAFARPGVLVSLRRRDGSSLCVNGILAAACRSFGAGVDVGRELVDHCPAMAPGRDNPTGPAARHEQTSGLLDSRLRISASPPGDTDTQLRIDRPYRPSVQVPGRLHTRSAHREAAHVVIDSSSG